ncbi:MAG: hypothetical protein HY956_10135 [Deltaproteobacteria bacterium]|nr:hypothetical protein [Deltaproteobacteria bacterium]
MKPKNEGGREKGFVLILALVTMIAMTVIGLSAVMNMTTDLQLSRNERDSKIAFQLAEAGINEMISRIHLPSTNANYTGEISGESGYRDDQWNSGNALGKNIGYGYGANRASAETLNYTVQISYLNDDNSENLCDSNEETDGSNNSGNALKVPDTASWNCPHGTTEVVMFGNDFKIPETVTFIDYGKQPVYKIESTGAYGTTQRTIIAYVGASNLNTDTSAAINTNGCVTISGGSTNITGGVLEYGSGGSCTTCDDGLGGCAAKGTEDVMNTYLGDNISEIINFADETHRCKNMTCSSAGPPADDIPASGKIDDVVLNWGDYTNDTYSTMIYVDNSGGKEVEIAGNFTGRGILIVTGDLKLSGTLQYEGLIYVFGQLRLSGTLNVTGGVMADSTVNVNGNVTATYDQSTLDAVSKENSSSTVILWKRM